MRLDDFSSREKVPFKGMLRGQGENIGNISRKATATFSGNISRKAAVTFSGNISRKATVTFSPWSLIYS